MSLLLTARPISSASVFRLPPPPPPPPPRHFFPLHQRLFCKVLLINSDSGDIQRVTLRHYVPLSATWYSSVTLRHNVPPSATWYSSVTLRHNVPPSATWSRNRLQGSFYDLLPPRGMLKTRLGVWSATGGGDSSVVRAPDS